MRIEDIEGLYFKMDLIQKLAEQNNEKLTNIMIAGISITIILGIAILWNQRKIKKMLREMQSIKEEETK